MEGTLERGSTHFDSAGAVSALWHLEYTRLCAFVSAMIVVYDCVLSLEREIELVWRKRWSIIKGVYLWHRYFGLFCILFEAIALSRNHASNDELNHLSFSSVRRTSAFENDFPHSAVKGSFWFQWEVWCYLSLVFTSEVTLILWIWVVYNRNRWLLAFLGATFVIEIGTVAVLLAVSIPSELAQSVLLPGRSFCITAPPKLTFKIVWLPILIFDLCLLAMFMYKGIRTSLSREARPSFGVYQMVYEHTLLNFFAITASYFACAIMWLVAAPDLAQIPVTFAMAFSVTNCTRLLLNIRRAYYFGTDDAEPGLLSWSVIAGGETLSVPHIVALPRLRGRQQRSQEFPGEIQVEVEVAVEVEVNRAVSESPKSFDDCREGEYELLEIKTIPR
ncbi:hypothetical protein BC835DRAFT_1414127 [Cytidiella melzeri]|nr:hypothetical protein BC835DRAFT_1414127 [Cytidiella melzeri]